MISDMNCNKLHARKACSDQELAPHCRRGLLQTPNSDQTSLQHARCVGTQQLEFDFFSGQLLPCMLIANSERTNLQQTPLTPFPCGRGETRLPIRTLAEARSPSQVSAIPLFSAWSGVHHGSAVVSIDWTESGTGPQDALPRICFQFFQTEFVSCVLFVMCKQLQLMGRTGDTFLFQDYGESSHDGPGWLAQPQLGGPGLLWICREGSPERLILNIRGSLRRIDAVQPVRHSLFRHTIVRMAVTFVSCINWA